MLQVGIEKLAWEGLEGRAGLPPLLRRERGRRWEKRQRGTMRSSPEDLFIISVLVDF